MSGGESASGRRPISRLLMVALFAMMIVPMLGWLVIVDTAAFRAAGVDVGAIRGRLAAVLAASLALFGILVLWVRVSLIKPMKRLAKRARSVGDRTWTTPDEVGQRDEVGDLALALDRAVRLLERRADEAMALASDLSHELRTPLAAIRGAAEILRDESPDPENARRFFENILAQSGRLERLVTGLLEAERQRHGLSTRIGAPEEIELTPWLLGLATTFKPLVERQRLRIEAHAEPRHASFDRERAERVLFSLMENAVRFAPEESTIRIEVKGAQGALLFSVRDEGPGVPESVMGRVFERRATGDRGPGRGNGLGLAIARELVEAAGGRIELQDVDRGACFAFSLPAGTLSVAS